jgi:N-methylhydantoinase A
VTQNEAATVSSATPARSQFVRDTVSGDVSPWSVFERAALAPGARIEGPAIIAENETSTLVGGGWHGTINRLGTIELTRGSRS